MLPHNHFLIAALAITPVAVIFPNDRSFTGIAEWVVAGGLLSAAIDLDIFVLVLLKSRDHENLKRFRNPLEIYRSFRLFMETIDETGVLRTGMMTHYVLSFLILVLCYFHLAGYFIPVALGVVTHLLSDMPKLKKI
ncbi:MAG TPA: hypothetical protein VK435_00955 [Thermodesulfovibrionales bacterium]|nr:hypothetical protein [Thermodesulfovibrionales bacterium]